MRLYRLPFPAKLLFPEALFRFRNTGKALCLTFDDGPDPESTGKVLDILAANSVNAVFFCSGQNAERYPELMENIRKAGHTVGNHGYSHLNGWLCRTNEYIYDIERAEIFTSRSLFRPPYGKLGISQYRILKEKFEIVMWDLMPYDFDLAAGDTKCLNVLKKSIRPGSVIALHDTGKSVVTRILRDFINYALANDYRFENPFNK